MQVASGHYLHVDLVVDGTANPSATARSQLQGSLQIPCYNIVPNLTEVGDRNVVLKLLLLHNIWNLQSLIQDPRELYDFHICQSLLRDSPELADLRKIIVI